MKVFIVLMVLAFSFSALAFNCRKECKEEFRQCKILVNESNDQLIDFHRSLPYEKEVLRKKLKEVKNKKKEELGYCKEMKKSCLEDCKN